MPFCFFISVGGKEYIAEPLNITVKNLIEYRCRAIDFDIQCGYRLLSLVILDPLADLIKNSESPKEVEYNLEMIKLGIINLPQLSFKNLVECEKIYYNNIKYVLTNENFFG